VVGSSIAREAGEGSVLYTWAGPEIAVASTKAYITQVEMLALLAMDLAVKRELLPETEYGALLHAMYDLPAGAAWLLNHREAMQRFADRNKDQKHVFFMGRGLDYALAMESSLKLKEVSYIFSEAYAAGELKHGTIALIEPARRWLRF
jgi:glucosamine--fructose-6-phosphate aminotransferase (isomerizing)